MGIDVKRLYRWATSLQGYEIEGFGFRGRTNKLVDGCYSWWVGGLFPLLEDIMGNHSAHIHPQDVPGDASGRKSFEKEEDWVDDDGTSLEFLSVHESDLMTQTFI
jgi:protein farnesyltransferase subunit beta